MSEIQKSAAAEKAALQPQPTDDPTLTLVELSREEEWHVTIEGSLLDWIALCDEHNAAPLAIELPDGRIQLMCAMDTDPRAHGELPPFLEETAKRGFTVLRVKHEVRELRDGEVALYYEAHAKLDGPWRNDLKNASRDLLRATLPVEQRRWYLTQRSAYPIAANAFAAATKLLAKQSTLVGVETEVVLEDTNPVLDMGWL